MWEDDKFGSSEVYTLCVMMISLEVWKFTSLHIVCDDDEFGSLEVYTLCVMLIRLMQGVERKSQPSVQYLRRS